MHCEGFGAELGVGKIVIPTTSMAHSAYGALASDIHHSAERSFLVRGGGGPLPGWHGIEADVLNDEFAPLEQRCRAALTAYGVADDEVQLSRSVDIRYRRQTHELIIPVPRGELTEHGVRELVERFEVVYEDTYGRGAAFREAGIELTTFRVDAVGLTRKPRLALPKQVADTPRRRRAVYDSTRGTMAPADIVDWVGLTAGERIDGPAVLEHPTTTVFVAAGQHAATDRHGNLMIELNGAQS
jgi:N-methylhydantoinase A